MSNISITSLCNQSCPYCFAQDALQKAAARSFMTLELFDRVLAYLKRSGIREARLLGGEPTLHPEILTMIDRAHETGLNVLLFTNGLIPEAVVTGIRERRRNKGSVKLLMNMSGFKTLPAQLKQHKLKVIETLAPQITLGLNIDNPAPEFRFLLDLQKEYKTEPAFRFGLAHPCLDTDNRYLHPVCYPEVGRKLYEFFKYIERTYQPIDFRFDCGFVPCMFPERALSEMGIDAAAIGRRCNPLPDILLNGDMIACYPLFSMKSLALTEDLDAEIVKDRFESLLEPYRKLGIYKRCSLCHLHQDGNCLGGCQALAMKRLRSGSFTVNIAEVEKQLK